MTASSSGRVDAIADGLRAQILSGKYGPGERLPSERELAARLGVHRSSVREALKQLEQLGMIAIRPGGGARVVPIGEAGLGVLRHLLGAKAPDRELVAQWLDVRELVVSGAARFAVERATPEEFAEARKLLGKLVAASTSDAEFVASGDRLMALIATASRNVVLQMVTNGLTAAAARHGDARHKLRPSRKVLLPIAADIERAMEERDPVAAEEAVRRLLRTNRAMVIDLVASPAPAN